MSPQKWIEKARVSWNIDAIATDERFCEKLDSLRAQGKEQKQ